MSFLDTSFLIDLLREEKRRTRGPAHQKLEQLSFTPVRLSLFVVCELEAGVSLSASKKERGHIHDPVEPVSDFAKDFQPVFSIVIGPIDGLAPASP